MRYEYMYTYTHIYNNSCFMDYVAQRHTHAHINTHTHTYTHKNRCVKDFMAQRALAHSAPLFLQVAIFCRVFPFFFFGNDPHHTYDMPDVYVWGYSFYLNESYHTYEFIMILGVFPFFFFEKIHITHITCRMFRCEVTHYILMSHTTHMNASWY